MKDLFEQDLKEKFFDILLNANRNIVEKELNEKFFEYCAIFEFLEEKNIDISKFVEFKVENKQDIQNRVDDFYIELMSKILSQNAS